MVTYIPTDDFTQTNGTAPNATYYNTCRLNTAATCNVQSNQLKLYTGSATGYAGSSGVVHVTSRTDVDLTFAWTTDSNDNSLEILLRSNASDLNYTTGYALQPIPGNNTVSFFKLVSNSFTSLAADASFTVTTNTQYYIRFRAVGTAIKAKIWGTSFASEPGGVGSDASWTFSVTDSSISSGYVGMIGHGASSAATSHLIDHLTLTDGASGATTNVTVNDVIGMVDSLNRSTTLTLVDLLGMVDSRAQTTSYTLTDILGMVDVAGVARQVLINDVLGMTDIVDNIIHAWSITDTMGIVDAVGISLNGGATNTVYTINDVIGIIDDTIVWTISSALTTTINIIDPLGIVDSFMKSGLVNVIDSMTLRDSYTRPTHSNLSVWNGFTEIPVLGITVLTAVGEISVTTLAINTAP